MSAFAALLRWRLPGLCSRLPEPCMEQLVSINWEQWSSTHPQSSPLSRQQFLSLFYSVHFHPLLPCMGYERNNKPHTSGSRGAQQKSFTLLPSNHRNSYIRRPGDPKEGFLSLKIYFHLKTFSFSIEFEPLTPNAMNATQLICPLSNPTCPDFYRTQQKLNLALLRTQMLLSLKKKKKKTTNQQQKNWYITRVRLMLPPRAELSTCLC